MSREKGPNRVEEMIESLREWQSIERQAMEQTAEIMEKTPNPFIRIIMEIIRSDSLMHHRVQQVIVDSLTRESVTLTPEEIGIVWDRIEEHNKTEKHVVKIAETLLGKAWTPIHKQLLNYLLVDEKKHDQLLEQLGELKKGMYPYGG